MKIFQRTEQIQQRHDNYREIDNNLHQELEYSTARHIKARKQHSRCCYGMKTCNISIRHYGSVNRKEKYDFILVMLTSNNQLTY